MACPTTELRAQAVEETSQPEFYYSTSDAAGAGGWFCDRLKTAGVIAGAAITSPFWGPPVWVGDIYAEPGFFPKYPYQYGEGYMLVGETEIVSNLEPPEVRWWTIHGRKEFGTDFSGTDWVAGHGVVETTSRWAADSDLHFFEEHMSSGHHHDSWVGDGNILYRFAQSPFLVMRSGLGMNLLADKQHTDLGFNFTYGGDYFPVRPWIVSGEIDVGTLGHAGLYHYRGTVGAIWWLCEAYIGYDHYDIGHTHIGGMVAGIRLWH